MEAKLKEIAENFSPFSWTQTATQKLLSFRGKHFTMELKSSQNKTEYHSVHDARNPEEP